LAGAAEDCLSLGVFEKSNEHSSSKTEHPKITKEPIAALRTETERTEIDKTEKLKIEYVFSFFAAISTAPTAIESLLFDRAEALSISEEWRLSDKIDALPIDLVLVFFEPSETLKIDVVSSSDDAIDKFRSFRLHPPSRTFSTSTREIVARQKIAMSNQFAISLHSSLGSQIQSNETATHTLSKVAANRHTCRQFIFWRMSSATPEKLETNQTATPKILARNQTAIPAKSIDDRAVNTPYCTKYRENVGGKILSVRG
jgi:hypothetical protein